MRGDFAEFGLSPAQSRAAGVITALAEEVSSGEGGRILFIDADPGCGMSHLLSSVGGGLWDLGCRVGTGRLPAAEDRGDLDLTGSMQAVAAGALSVAATFDPSLSLMASVAGFSAAAAQALRIGAAEDQPSELLTRVLRAAAREAPDQPLVCLVDDARWLSGAWWTELQFSFAREVCERLPLLLVVAVGSGLAADGDGDAQSSRVERSLVQRGLAESVRLDALTSEELGEWLDLKPREAVRGAFDLTRGRTGEVAELCRAWLAQGAMEHEKRGLRLEDPDVLVDGAATDLASRLDQLRGGRARVNEDLLREVLAFGALEGRSFTAAAVARALESDEDPVEDLLDELVAETPEAGVLLPPTVIEIEDPPGSEAREIWRFEFANRVLWRAAQRRLSDVPVAIAADRMRKALVEVFGGATPANLLGLARLAELAGAPEQAAYYRRLVTSPSDAALKAEADLLIAADQADWTAADFRDAAYVMALAAEELDRKGVPGLLTYTREGARYAKQAGQLGRRALAKVLAVEGRVLQRPGRYEEAEAKLREAREIVKQGSPELLAGILCQLAELLRETEGPVDERKSLLEKSLRLYQGSRNDHGEAAVYWNLAGIAADEERDLARGRELNEKALLMMRAVLNERNEMIMTGQRANIELLDGDLDAAREFLDKALRYEIATGEERGRAGSLVMLARIELAAKNYDTAWDLGWSTLTLVRNLEMFAAEARLLHVLGQIAAARGNRDQAEELLEEAEVLLREQGWIRQLRQVEEKLRDLRAE